MEKNEISVEGGLGGQDRSQQRLAYTALIKNYSKQLFDFGYRFCQDEDIVKDCLQQLYLDLWNRGFEPEEGGKIKSYLFKAVRNRVLREKPKWTHGASLDDDYDFVLEFGVETRLIIDSEDRLLADKLEKVLNTLPSRQREVIYLKFFEGLDARQISSVMNIHQQSVHNLLQKAYQNIRVDWKVLALLFSIHNIH